VRDHIRGQAAVRQCAMTRRVDCLYRAAGERLPDNEIAITIRRDVKRSFCRARPDELYKLWEGSHIGKFRIVRNLLARIALCDSLLESCYRLCGFSQQTINLCFTVYDLQVLRRFRTR